MTPDRETVSEPLRGSNGLTIDKDELGRRFNAVMEAHAWDWTTCAVAQLARSLGFTVTGINCVNGDKCPCAQPPEGTQR
jgi:hypothetical protein